MEEAGLCNAHDCVIVVKGAVVCECIGMGITGIWPLEGGLNDEML
jgi:hypothetical protein